MYFSSASVVLRIGLYANCDGHVTSLMVNLILSTTTCSANIIKILVGNVYIHWGCCIKVIVLFVAFSSYWDRWHHAWGWFTKVKQCTTTKVTQRIDTQLKPFSFVITDWEYFVVINLIMVKYDNMEPWHGHHNQNHCMGYSVCSMTLSFYHCTKR